MLNVSKIMNSTSKTLVLFFDPAIEHLKAKIEYDVLVLNDLETRYYDIKNMIEVFKVQKNVLVRDKLEEQTICQLTLNYLELFLTKILSNNVDDIDKIIDEYCATLRQLRSNQKSSTLSNDFKKNVSDDDLAEISYLWKMLVKIFHPDRYSNLNKREACQRVSSLINDARDQSNIILLREIASDPEAFLLIKEWSLLSPTESFCLDRLESMHNSIIFKIIKYNEMIEEVSCQPEYRMSQISAKVPSYLKSIAKQLNDEKNIEISIINKQCEKILYEISLCQNGIFSKKAECINPRQA